jgi:hypothetical protein
VSLIRLDPGGYYRFGSVKGYRPVDVFVGRIDEPAELGFKVDVPVVSMVITSSRPGLPVLGFAPFFVSALYPEGVAAIPPFDLKGVVFDRNYRDWRAKFDAGEAKVWEESPAEVYRQMLYDIAESQKNIRRPN